jgi:hypothetical protein
MPCHVVIPDCGDDAAYPPWKYTFTGNFFWVGKDGGTKMLRKRLKKRESVESLDVNS